MRSDWRAVLVLPLLAIGCSGPTPDPTGLPCSESDDCAIDGYSVEELDAFCVFPGIMTRDGFCHRLCEQDGDCAPYSICHLEQCKPTCETSDDCRIGWECGEVLVEGQPAGVCSAIRVDP